MNDKMKELRKELLEVFEQAKGDVRYGLGWLERYNKLNEGADKTVSYKPKHWITADMNYHPEQRQEPDSDLKRIVGRTHHELKTLKPYFNAGWEGTKLFETRKNDRAFQRGDIVTLMEIRPDGVQTGRRIDAEVGFVLSDFQDLGYVTFSLLNINRNG
jgi:hypothetical protein